MWEMDGDTFKQPADYGSHPTVGTESVDPAPVTCSDVQTCDDKRPSDAAFVTLSTSSGAIKGRRGAIVRTLYRSSDEDGSDVVDYDHPWINMSNQGMASFISVGMTLNKMGFRTGWTYGNVTETCVDRELSSGGKTHRIFCMTRAAMYSGHGDSGGPVFSWDGGDGGTYYGVVSLLGNGCGADVNDFCDNLYFSSLGQIEQDLGSVNVTSQITVGSPNVTITFDEADRPYLSWSAVPTTFGYATTQYVILRSVWDASTYTWTEQGNTIGSVSTTHFTDTALPFTESGYTAQSKPADCTYTHAYYYVIAVNSGIYSVSDIQYVQGPANGPTPEVRECQ